jgi:thymidylate synthase (FAD)
MRQDVLDKGFVDLVDHMGSDLTVCNAARVSFSKETDWEVDEEALARIKQPIAPWVREECKILSKKDVNLIKFLAEHGHWTPFAHPQITLRIKAPVSIRTQFFKHKQGFVENEISRRYVSFEPDFYYPEWRGKPTNGAKQGSEHFIEINQDIKKQYNTAVRVALYTYEQLLEEGVAPEQARFVLPQGMYTEWYWTGSLSAYARFYKQRIDSHAQWEIREYAESIGKLIQPLFPQSWNALTCH